MIEVQKSSQDKMNLRDIHVRSDEIALENKLMGKVSHGLWDASKFWD